LRTFLAISGLVLLTGLTAACFADDVVRIAAIDAAGLVRDGKAILVDVREPAEWTATGVATPATLLPMSDFQGARKLWRPFLEQHAGKELILYCRSGRRSGLVAQALAAEGWKTRNAGGFQDWVKAGLPTRAP
jgi:rhodanese-related sulfurtransferase